MQIDKYKQSVDFHAEEGEILSVVFTNRGEPYREGIQMCLTAGFQQQAYLFLEDREAKELRDLLNRLYP